MTRVLVTGGSGFIGRHVLELLKKKYEIFAVSQKEMPKENGICWLQCNILNPCDVEETINAICPSHLLHLAWYTEHGKIWSAKENLDWLKSSLYLVQCFAKNGGKRFVGAGSCAEYDWQKPLCVEGQEGIPQSLYGRCKTALQITSEKFLESFDVTSAWGRVFYTFGPHENPIRLVSYVISALLRREEVLCSNGLQTRDFLYVKDVASAFIALLESQVSGPVNIASGQGIQIKSIIANIAQKLDGEKLIRLGTRPTRTDEPQTILADVAKLQKQVGWKATYNIESALDETILEWKNETNHR